MCRRCSECKNSSHHWIYNSAFGDDPDSRENAETSHVCKHCDACGNACEDCGGDGVAFDIVGEPGITRQCLTCEGEGVILVSGGNEAAKPIRGSDIPKTGHHDAGAIARCSYCGRYSDNPKALQYDPRATSAKDLRCDCGKTHGWSGSFKRPTAGSIWSK